MRKSSFWKRANIRFNNSQRKSGVCGFGLILFLAACKPIIDSDTANAVAYSFAKEKIVPFTRGDNSSVQASFDSLQYSVISTEKSGSNWLVMMQISGSTMNLSKTANASIIVDGISGQVISVNGQAVKAT
jgi:hypothetical protein